MFLEVNALKLIKKNLNDHFLSSFMNVWNFLGGNITFFKCPSMCTNDVKIEVLIWVNMMDLCLKMCKNYKYIFGHHNLMFWDKKYFSWWPFMCWTIVPNYLTNRSIQTYLQASLPNTYGLIQQSFLKIRIKWTL